MDSPPSDRSTPADELPDELLEFIDEATLLLEGRPAGRAPSLPQSDGPAVSVKSVVLENISVAERLTTSRPLEAPAIPTRTFVTNSRPAINAARGTTAPAEPPAPATPEPHHAAPLKAAPAEDALNHSIESDRDVTVADLCTARIERSWQEAVSVWLELLDGWPEDAGCPRPDATIVSIAGTVRALPTVTLDGDPVQRAAALLGDLLPAAYVPAELMTLLEREKSAQHERRSIKELVSAVSYFGRPNRRTDVSALCERGVQFYRTVQADRQVELLRTKVTEELDRRTFLWPNWLVRFRPQTSHAALSVGLWTLIGINSATLVWFAVTPAPVRTIPPSDVRPAVAPAVPAVPGEVSPFVGPIRPEPELTPAVAHVPPRAIAPPPAPPRIVVKSAPEVGVPPAQVEAGAARPGEWNVFVREVLPERQASAAEGDAITVYSEADPDVTPAVLVRPQVTLATEPAGPHNAVSEFELIVSRDGRVERVRLLSPGNQLRDKMLLAAAKAWQFQPALRGGQSVRYRLRLRVQR